MKLLTGTLALMGLASIALCQYNNQSAPFALVVLSDTNSTINGSTLSACHEGAAIEGLCRGASLTTANTSYVTYQFNTSDSATVPNATFGATGYLTYELRGGNFNVSEPMNFVYNDVSNVALPLFEPGSTGTGVAFDSDDYMNVQSYFTDENAPNFYPQGYVAYYRWYICTTYYSGYTYSTLAWVMGNGEPQNPTCQKVCVKRVFTSS